MAEVINGVPVPADVEHEGRAAIAAWAAKKAPITGAPARPAPSPSPDEE